MTSGNFCGVSVGDTEAHVRDALGEPSDMSVSAAPSIWKYDDVELHLEGGRVVLLHTDTDHFSISRANVERMLNEKGIACRVDQSLTFDDQTAVATTSGASMIFDEHQILVSVSVRKHG